MRRIAVKASLFGISCLFGVVWFTPAQAQLMLPGAANPTPAGSKPAAATAPAKAGKAAKRGSGKKSGNGGASESGGEPITRAPAEETIAGQQFQRNGSNGIIGLDRNARSLEISKLILVGYQIAKPAELCRVDLSASKISLKAAPRHQGLISYEAELEACPFTLDILDGAVRVRGKICEFKAADCNADPSGVWGPPGAAIGPEQGKSIEKLRGKADKDARAGFRALLANVKGDRPRTKEVVRDQASFSSVREELCRDYSREDAHGFCASRVTLARAVALSAEIRGDGTPDDGKKTAPTRAGGKKNPGNPAKRRSAPVSTAVASPNFSPAQLPAPAPRVQ